jgi:PadR family transcriptional regulator PadR
MKTKKNLRDEPLPSLSGKESVVLEMLLAVSRELYGLEMVEASAGLLKRGTIYVTLQRMEEKGLIESRQEARPEGEIGIARRLYRVTGLGARAFIEHTSRRQAFANSLIAVGG